MNSLIELFDEFSYEDILYARENVPKYALNTKLGSKKISDLAKEILKLAKIGLKNDNDIKFLEIIEKLTIKGLCPADLIKHQV